MSLLEGALVFLVLVWTIIFILIAVAIWVLYRAIRKALNRVDHILEATEQRAESIDLPSKIAVSALLGFMGKGSFSSIKKIASMFLNRKDK